MKFIGSDVPDLLKEGIQIRTDNDTKSLMHNKFVVIDEQITMTGSYNWTAKATSYNEENILIIENEQIANSFTTEFEKLWKQFAPQIPTETNSKEKQKTRLFLRYINNVKKLEEKKNEKDGEKDIIRQSKKISKIKKLHPTKNSSQTKKSKSAKSSQQTSAAGTLGAVILY
jgi:phosphatidylserine/phosphatidylglycerophosphate/cardiolipin synthase-like enzyme